MEGKKSRGNIAMKKDNWKNDDAGDLPSIEGEFIAEVIEFNHGS